MYESCHNLFDSMYTVNKPLLIEPTTFASIYIYHVPERMDCKLLYFFHLYYAVPTMIGCLNIYYIALIEYDMKALYMLLYSY